MFSYKTSLASLAFAVALLCVPNVSFAYNLKHSSSGHVIRWGHRNVTLRVDPALENMLGAGEVRSAIVMASEAWRGFAGVPDIAIAEGAPPAYDHSRRGNGVYLLAKWPFESKQLAVTIVTYADSGEVLGADVLVNGEKRFAVFGEGPNFGASDRYDIAAVMTHEFGHVLGLDESFEHPEATMWPQIHQGEVRQRLLSDDDQQGVMEAYNAPMASSEPRMSCSASAPHAANHGAAALLGVGSLAVVIARRNRRRAA